MVVPSTANGFRAAVSALRSLDGGGGWGCEFPHLHAPGGLLCTASGEKTGQGHAWERRPGGAGVPGYSCPGSYTSTFRPSWPGHSQGPPSHPHFIVSAALGPEVSKVRSITELCGLRVSVETYVDPKAQCNASAASASETRSITAIRAPACRMWWLPPLRWVLYPARAASVLWLRGQPLGELQGLC